MSFINHLRNVCIDDNMKLVIDYFISRLVNGLMESGITEEEAFGFLTDLMYEQGPMVGLPNFVPRRVHASMCHMRR